MPAFECSSATGNGVRILNRGLMDDELFFENKTSSGSYGSRSSRSSLAMRSLEESRLFAQLEAAATRLEAWWIDRARISRPSSQPIAQLIAQAASAAANS